MRLKAELFRDETYVNEPLGTVSAMYHEQFAVLKCETELSLSRHAGLVMDCRTGFERSANRTLVTPPATGSDLPFSRYGEAV
jgi:hypothetical protein